MGIYKYEKEPVSTYKSSQNYMTEIWKYRNILVLG